MSTQRWTAAGAAARSMRKLDALQARIEQLLGGIACEWADEDASLEFSADELIREFSYRIDEFKKEIRENLDAREIS